MVEVTPVYPPASGSYLCVDCSDPAMCGLADQVN